MNISSENIVDVFLRKISESLPVGERDAYQDWKRNQEYNAAHAADHRYDTVAKRKKAKKIAEVIYQLTKFFRFDDTDSKYSLSSDRYGDILLNNGLDQSEIAEVSSNGTLAFPEGFNNLMDSYGIKCEYNYDNRCFEISLTGKREVVGPLYGKLKKLGFNPNRRVDSYITSVGYIENELTFEFQPDEFIEAIKKGLRITDFTNAQSE